MEPFVISLWLLWCLLHSLLIALRVEAWVRKYFPRLMIWYRLSYNVFALASFTGLVLLTRQFSQELVFQWAGAGMVLRFLLLTLALCLFASGAAKYEMDSFLGIRQVRQKKEVHLLNGREMISTNGVLGVVRHPWYSGTLLLLWSYRAEYGGLDVAVSCILSCYIFLGAWLEERKIVARHGETYVAYCRQVSMFVPWKWFLRKIDPDASRK